jgi:glycogen debranching enzyme
MTTRTTTEARRAEAVAILRANDRGGYTVPTARLYPFQWNWDSAFAAMGFMAFDEARAWTELDTLFLGQWADGLVPHIVFHQPADSYFPGPEVWGTRHVPPTSGISQPPVAAIAALRMHEAAADRTLADARARALLPKLAASHRWWATARDPEGRGLPALLHNWESGMDNSPAWDGPFQSVPATATPYVRKDTGHVAAAMRPRKEDYDRYVHLVETYRACGWEPAAMWRAAPFKVAHIGVNAILLRAEEDLAKLAGRLGDAAVRAEAEGRAARLTAAMRLLWSDGMKAFQSVDLIAGARIAAATSAGFLPLVTGAPTPEQARAMAAEIMRWRSLGRYGVPTVAPDDPAFDGKRYWRGPVWCIMNWLLADGLARHGSAVEAEAVRDDTARLLLDHGFAEYFDPLDGAPCGGLGFTWTAAAGLAFAFPSPPRGASRSLDGGDAARRRA